MVRGRSTRKVRIHRGGAGYLTENQWSSLVNTPKSTKNKPSNSKESHNNIPPENKNHPEKKVNDSKLPEGWSKVQLENNPKVVWYENESTGERQWYAPGNAENDPIVLEENSGLPSGWKKAHHRNNNAGTKAEWYEHNDGSTQWNRPSNINNIQIGHNNIPPENKNHPEKKVNDSKLPEGWSKVQLENNPKVVWYENESTGERQWYAPGNAENDPIVLEENSGLPSGWKKAHHRNNNAGTKAEWYEHNDGSTQWNRPSSSANMNVSNNKQQKNNQYNSVFQKLNGLKNTLNSAMTQLQNVQAGGRKRKTCRKNRKSRRSSRR